MKKIVLIAIFSVFLTSCAKITSNSFEKAKEYCLSIGGEYKSVPASVRGHNTYASKCKLPNGELADLYVLFRSRPVVSSGIFDSIEK